MVNPARRRIFRAEALCWVSCAAILAATGCKSKASNSSDGGAPPVAPQIASAPVAYVAAEAHRSVAEVPGEAVHGDDLPRRRAAARAHARIQGESLVPLHELLADDDEEVLAWAAYGLGFGCAGKEETTVPVLAARLATRLRDEPAPSAATPLFRGSDALLRALGSCGTKVAEGLIAARLNLELSANSATNAAKPARTGSHAAAAATALGVIAGKRKRLDDESLAALLGVAEAGEPDARAQALWALGRAELGAFVDRAKKAAAAAVDAPAVAQGSSANTNDTGLFALRLAAKTGALSSDRFVALAADDARAVALRMEAVRGLDTPAAASAPTPSPSKNGADREEKSAPSRAIPLAKLVDLLAPRLADPVHLARDYAVAARTIVALGGAVRPNGAKSDDPIALAALTKLAKIPVPSGDSQDAGVRRATNLRCQAAVPLALGNPEAAVLTACDPAKGAAWHRAKADVLVSRPLEGARLNAYAALAKGATAAERERLLGTLGTHAEAADLAATWVTEGLTGTEPGVVATAATFVHEHREILAFARSTKNAKEPLWLTALDAATKKTWAPDLVETRVAILEAFATARAEAATPLLNASACDANVTVRTRVRALLGTHAPACPPLVLRAGADELPVANAPVELTMRLDSGLALRLHLDERWAPMTVARIANLARDHFYDGVVVHRVVPGFVVQFGDKLGDGFGGSGQALPCETSPIPFGVGSVGMALAGRDTGSSQLFVTLAPTPHLDGLYTLFGSADGPWDQVAEGDVIRTVQVGP